MNIGKVIFLITLSTEILNACLYLNIEGEDRSRRTVLDNFRLSILTSAFSALVRVKSSDIVTVAEKNNSQNFKTVYRFKVKIIKGVRVPVNLPSDRIIEFTTDLNDCTYVMKEGTTHFLFGEYVDDGWLFETGQGSRPVDLNDQTDKFLKIFLDYFRLNKKQEALP